MNNIPFIIGHPQLIHQSLIAIQADLQSIVIFTSDGKLLGWIHQHNKYINFAYGQESKIDLLIRESTLSDTLQGYSISYFDNGIYSKRTWAIKTQFIYPAPTPTIPTIATEDQY